MVLFDPLFFRVIGQKTIWAAQVPMSKLFVESLSKKATAQEYIDMDLL